MTVSEGALFFTRASDLHTLSGYGDSFAALSAASASPRKHKNKT